MTTIISRATVRYQLATALRRINRTEPNSTSRKPRKSPGFSCWPVRFESLRPTYEPGGRGFESLRARQLTSLHAGHLQRLNDKGNSKVPNPRRARTHIGLRLTCPPTEKLQTINLHEIGKFESQRAFLRTGAPRAGPGRSRFKKGVVYHQVLAHRLAVRPEEWFANGLPGELHLSLQCELTSSRTAALGDDSIRRRLDGLRSCGAVPQI